MARAYASASSQYHEIASSVPGSGPTTFTMATWFYAADTTSTFALMALGTNGSVGRAVMFAAAGQILYSYVNSTNTASGSATTAAASPYSTNTWTHACVVNASTTSHSAFIRGADKATGTTAVTLSGMDRTNLGCRWNTTRGVFLNGGLAETAMWSVALSDAEVASLGSGYCPLLIRPQSLIGYWPLFARATNEEDWAGSNPFVPTNTPTAVAHPSRLIYPSRRKLILPAAAAAGNLFRTPLLNGLGAGGPFFNNPLG